MQSTSSVNSPSPGLMKEDACSRSQWHQTATTKYTQLVFDGSCNLSSRHFPHDVTREELSAFLMKKATRDMFFSIGGTRTVVEHEMTTSIRSMWIDITNKYYPSSASRLLPLDDDSIVSCDTTIQFPGLTVKTTALNGIKLNRYDDHSKFPSYTVLGIAERQQAAGTKPFVWLFNTITGSSSKEKDRFYPATTRALSYISVIEHDKGQYSLQFDVDLKVAANVPCALLRFLPFSKDKVEEKGSKAVLRTLSKDIQVALDHVRETFLKERAET